MVEALPIVVIYKDPSDYPGCFVARRQWASAGEILIDAEPLAIAGNVHDVRSVVPPGMVRIPRSPDDEPHLLESWI